MTQHLKILSIHWMQTIPIRHCVLWPDRPPEFCALDGDKDAWHFGAFMHEELVGVASVFITQSGARLRKFATLKDFRHQGIGSALLMHALQMAEAQGLQYFWCDARESALPFYARFGMTAEGERFYKSNVPYFKMSRSLP